MLKSVFVFGAAALLISNAAIAGLDDTYEGNSEQEFQVFMKGIDREFPNAEDQKLAGEGFLAMVLERYPASREAKGLAAFAMLPDAIKAAPTTFQGVSYRDLHERGVAQAAENAATKSAETAKEAMGQKTLSCLQSSVRIDNIAFKIEDSSWSNEKLLRLSYTVSNGLDRAIKETSISFEIRSPGREVAWRDGVLGNDIPGGIEPGETAALSFLMGGSENSFLEDAGRDYEVRLNISDVKDANGESFVPQYGRDGFGAEFCARQEILGIISPSN